MERFSRFLKTWLLSAITMLFCLAVIVYLTEKSFSPVIDVIYGQDGENLFLFGFLGLIAGLISLAFPTRKEKEEKRVAMEKLKREQQKREEERRQEEERKKREQEDRERARTAPGCHDMDNVNIMTFRSMNNVLTAGNNFVTMRIRNKNPYGVFVTVKFKYSYGWSSSTQTFQVDGNQIREINTSGEAWRKAYDVSIVAVY